MASYNRIKATQQAPIGTIMPYGGASGSNNTDGVPPGWIILSAGQKGLNAADYPLLASVIGNVYGPFPASTQEEIGLNIGIIFESNGGKGFPYNPPSGRPGHDTSKPVDKFDLPNLNQIALVDLEATRLSNVNEYNPGDPSANPPVKADHRYSTLVDIGEYLSPNGSSGVQAKTNLKSNIDLVFGVEQSNNLAGRIRGITMEDPVWFNTVYVLPRKLGIDHTPRHSHRAATESVDDQFWGANPLASPILEFQPGAAQRANSDAQTTTVQPSSVRSSTLPAQSYRNAIGNITWYDQEDGGTSMVLTDRQWNIGSDTDGDGDVDTKKKLPDTDVYPSAGSLTRTIPNYNGITSSYDDDYSGVAAVAADAIVGAFPPPGDYNGKINYYASPDIPAHHRGSGMPSEYVNKMSYTGSQPINSNVPETTGNTFSTTENHPKERWAGNLRAHQHDAMEISMGSGLSISSTVLVNNVSLGTTSPRTQETALTVTVNPNTPSVTMMYIMRAF